MSLSLHSSMEALTSSKRGLEKDRLIEPEKSSIGESSVRISSRPDRTVLSAPMRARQRSLPTSQSNDWVCSARRLGTSSGSRIFAKEVRGGAPGIPDRVVERAVPERETAKMRPSEDSNHEHCARWDTLGRPAAPAHSGAGVVWCWSCGYYVRRTRPRSVPCGRVKANPVTGRGRTRAAQRAIVTREGATSKPTSGLSPVATRGLCCSRFVRTWPRARRESRTDRSVPGPWPRRQALRAVRRAVPEPDGSVSRAR